MPTVPTRWASRRSSEARLDAKQRLAIYVSMVEVDRKWVSVFDAKASAICALNTLLLGFIWTAAKLTEAGEWAHHLGLASTGASLISLWFALRVVLPRSILASALRTNATYSPGFKAVSFFGYVAQTYGPTEEKRFRDDLWPMNMNQLAREAIEQHFTISHILQQKSDGVEKAGWVWILGVVFCVAGLALRS